MDNGKGGQIVYVPLSDHALQVKMAEALKEQCINDIMTVLGFNVTSSGVYIEGSEGSIDHLIEWWGLNDVRGRNNCPSIATDRDAPASAHRS